jgi:tryptophanyl-tRNA synthetase
MYNLTTLYINTGRNERMEIIAFIEKKTTDLIFIREPHLEDNETKERSGYAKLKNGKMVVEYAKNKVLEDIENVMETEHTRTLRLKDNIRYFPDHPS